MSPTCLARYATPAVSTRRSVSTGSAVETLASGGVTSLGTSAGEDARTLTVRRAGEPTTGSYNNKIVTVLYLQINKQYMFCLSTTSISSSYGTLSSCSSAMLFYIYIVLLRRLSVALLLNIVELI